VIRLLPSVLAITILLSGCVTITKRIYVQPDGTESSNTSVTFNGSNTNSGDCPNPNTTKRVIQIQDLKNLDISSNLEVVVMPGDNSVTIDARECDQDKIVAQFSNGDLLLGQKNNTVTQKAKITIGTKAKYNMTNIGVSGNSSLDIKNPDIIADSVVLVVSGNSAVTALDDQTALLKFDISGNSNVTYDGMNLERLNGKISGNSQMLLGFKYITISEVSATGNSLLKSNSGLNVGNDD
jgi:uncharacterized protein YceK